MSSNLVDPRLPSRLSKPFEILHRALQYRYCALCNISNILGNLEIREVQRRFGFDMNFGCISYIETAPVYWILIVSSIAYVIDLDHHNRLWEWSWFRVSSVHPERRYRWEDFILVFNALYFSSEYRGCAIWGIRPKVTWNSNLANSRLSITSVSVSHSFWHGSIAAVLCAKFQNDGATETDVMQGRDFANLSFKWPSETYIAQCIPPHPHFYKRPGALLGLFVTVTL